MGRIPLSDESLDPTDDPADYGIEDDEGPYGDDSYVELDFEDDPYEFEGDEEYEDYEDPLEDEQDYDDGEDDL